MEMSSSRRYSAGGITHRSLNLVEPSVRELQPTHSKETPQQELKEEENIYFDVYELEYSYDNLLEVSIFWHGDEHDKIYLDKNQFKKFIDLLNDPDIYKNAKKYNL